MDRRFFIKAFGALAGMMGSGVAAKADAEPEAPEDTVTCLAEEYVADLLQGCSSLELTSSEDVGEDGSRVCQFSAQFNIALPSGSTDYALRNKLLKFCWVRHHGGVVCRFKPKAVVIHQIATTNFYRVSWQAEYRVPAGKA